MLCTIWLAGHDHGATKPEISMLGIANGPTAGLRRQVGQSKYAGFLLGRGGLGLALNGRRTALQTEAVRLADHGVLGNAEAFSNFTCRQTFRPQALQFHYFFVCPAHRANP